MFVGGRPVVRPEQPPFEQGHDLVHVGQQLRGSLGLTLEKRDTMLVPVATQRVVAQLFQSALFSRNWRALSRNVVEDRFCLPFRAREQSPSESGTGRVGTLISRLAMGQRGSA